MRLVEVKVIQEDGKFFRVVSLGETVYGKFQMTGNVTTDMNNPDLRDAMLKAGIDAQKES